MRLLLCASLGAIVCSSSCVALDNESKRTSSSTSVRRIETFTKRIAQTLADVSTDIAPVVTAIGKEAFREAKQDLPRMTGELQSQLNPFSERPAPRRSQP